MVMCSRDSDRIAHIFFEWVDGGQCNSLLYGRQGLDMGHEVRCRSHVCRVLELHHTTA